MSGATDALGMPLLRDEVKEEQKRHAKCIQDPEGVALYTQTGTSRKGNTTLPVFRSARGSTSLESFHLHLARLKLDTVKRLLSGRRRYGHVPPPGAA